MNQGAKVLIRLFLSSVRRACSQLLSEWLKEIHLKMAQMSGTVKCFCFWHLLVAFWNSLSQINEVLRGIWTEPWETRNPCLVTLLEASLRQHSKLSKFDAGQTYYSNQAFVPCHLEAVILWHPDRTWSFFSRFFVGCCCETIWNSFRSASCSDLAASLLKSSHRTLMKFHDISCLN